MKGFISSDRMKAILDSVGVLSGFEAESGAKHERDSIVHFLFQNKRPFTAAKGQQPTLHTLIEMKEAAN